MLFKNRFTLRAENVFRSSHECAAEMGHGYVGSEHILLGLLRENGSKASQILSDCGIKPKEVQEKICENIGVGNSAKDTIQGLTPHAQKVVKHAYEKSCEKGKGFIGTEDLLSGILQEEGCAGKKLLLSVCGDVEKLRHALYASGGGGEADYRRAGGDVRQGKEKGEPKLLKNFGRDLCELAKEGRFDPVIGREKEINRVTQILVRRTKNNPILLGDPGVGKTAIAEALAERIVRGEVPPPLLDKKIYMLDISAVVAGTKYRGEFEERIKSILKEVTRSKNIIIFIDEIHTIVGAGSAEGAIDAANILKPAMSRREIQVIGATTYEEYKKYIEKDSALNRRFQPVRVSEPSEKEAFEILCGIKKKYEEYHKIAITDDAIKAAISLSVRYLNDRNLPDKAIDLIDEAASRAKLNTSSPPPRMSELEKEITEVVGMKINHAKIQDYEAAARLRDHEAKLRQELALISKKWKSVIEGKGEITGDSIAEVICEQTGVPTSQITENEGARLMKLEELLEARVKGQKEAVLAISAAIRRGRCGLSDPKRPIGSFLFAGPTGVGKTELCRALAEVLFGDEKKIIRVDMSEYMERHETSKLIGSPPGYIGHEDGGALTDKVRKNPYSVVLFDEIEKAHPDVANILLQILEDGTLTDSHGRVTDFKNTVIVMTSNVGAEKFLSDTVGFSQGSENKDNLLKKSIAGEIRKSFSPELINRIDEIIVFRQLSEAVVSEICGNMLQTTRLRAEKIGINLEISDAAQKLIAKKGYDIKYGARPIRRTIQREIEDKLAELFLSRGCGGGRYIIDAEAEKIKIKSTED